MGGISREKAMRSYRFYYTEREVKDNQGGSIMGDALGSAGGGMAPLEVAGEEWEETVDAKVAEATGGGGGAFHTGYLVKKG